MNQTPLVPWNRLKGNKFNLSLHPAMLSDFGYVKTRTTTVVGETVPQQYQVKYDRAYVIAWLRSQLFDKLTSIPWSDLSTLLEQALAESNHQDAFTKDDYAELIAKETAAF